MVKKTRQTDFIVNKEFGLFDSSLNIMYTVSLVSREMK